jgi:preprotein translocase subunit SecA
LDRTRLHVRDGISGAAEDSMATQTQLEPGILEKLGDKLNGFVEGSFGFITRLFGSANDRMVKSIGFSRAKNAEQHTVIPGSILDKTNRLEESMKVLSDDELKGLTVKFRERLAKGETLEDLMPEAFAACREAGRRTKGMRHYDVQIVGGAVLHRGAIAEMVTGEGKTLVATLPAYLNALEGRGVHVVTVNDYLARRDCEWMLPIYNALGVTAAFIQSDQDPMAKRYAYECDITYGTNSEFGFDYLRDNMKPARFDDERYNPYYRQVQRTPLNFALIDEVDNILIDEARTPLIISGPAFTDVKQYEKADEIARKLTDMERKGRQELKASGKMTLGGTEGDGMPVVLPLDPDKIDPQNPPPKGVYFEIKEKERTCHLTDAGVREAEKLAGVESFYTVGNMEWPHLIDNALRCHHLYKRDRDYMIAADPRENNELGIIIIDTGTGRAMFGRQWSDGLHQAVEAKHRRDGVRIKQETQTLATVTLQNFCKLYRKVGGMTGTAMTEANEFWKIYKLDVVAVPTNRPLKRINYTDTVYKTVNEKWDAVVKEVVEVHQSGRPILIGTTDVAKSEQLSAMLKRKGIKHELLNAKPENVAREAEIVAQAGRAGAVTISTNMAGRGTDIILGGNPETLAWAQLKNTKNPDGNLAYPTRLEVPNDIWTNTVQKIANEYSMKEEGRRIAEQGGLHIIGTERHESRRIDNQLRGRAGRQGDPGSSRFYLSLEDDLMRLFGGERLRRLMNNPWLGLKDGEAIESGMLTRQIEKAQKRVEEYHFEQRKNLLDYDEVMDYQRKRTYGQRQAILDGKNPRGIILDMIDAQVTTAVERYTDERYGAASFAEFAQNRLGVEFSANDFRNTYFEEAVTVAREKASKLAPGFIVEAMDESLNPDEDPSDWKWQEFTRAINSRLNLKTSEAELKQIGRDDLSEFLVQEAERSLNEVDLSDGKRFLERRHGADSLCDWVRQKFGLQVNLNEVSSLEPVDLLAMVRRKVREAYRAKDLDFPVQVGLHAFLPEKLRPDRRPNREQLFAFSMTRFPGASVSEEVMRTEPRERIREAMIAANSAYMPTADYPEIDAKIAEELSGAKITESADASELADWCKALLNIDIDPATLTGITQAQVRDAILNAFDLKYRPEMRDTERSLVLDQLDQAWKSHLLTMDHLRSTVGMAGYAQEDPKIIYKREGMKLFDQMWVGVDDRVTESIFRMEEMADDQVQSALWAGASAMQSTAQSAMQVARQREATASQQAQVQAAANAGGGEAKKVEQIRNVGAKVGRNDPCPCGSGKKYKNCHMKVEAV